MLVSFNGAETKMSRKCSEQADKNMVQYLLQWGRDKNVSEMLLPQRLGSLTILLQWGRDKNVSEMRMDRAYSKLRLKLQWGRDKNVSEILRLIWHIIPELRASMGPRQKCLGNYAISHKFIITAMFASMGPRQKCLGNHLHKVSH